MAGLWNNLHLIQSKSKDWKPKQFNSVWKRENQNT